MSTQQERFIEIADKIREKTGSTDLIKPNEFANKIDDVYNAGITASEGYEIAYSEFWDIFQKNGERLDYKYAFTEGWNDINFKPKYDIIGNSGGSYENVFFLCRITDLKGILEANNVVMDMVFGRYSFYGTTITRLPEIKATHPSSSRNSLFGHSTKLESIDKLILDEYDSNAASTNFSNMFTNCYQLKDIVIEGDIYSNGLNFKWSTLLTHDSLMSIIEALYDYSTDTSGKTWLITLGSENIAKLSNDELARIEAKGWTYE